MKESWLRIAYYAGIAVLVYAQLGFLPGNAWLQTTLAFQVGSNLALSTIIALGVGAGATLAYLRRFG